MYEEELLSLETTIESSDKYNGKKVSELVEKKGVIFQMIKKGYRFDDKVLEAAKITKNIRNHEAISVIAEHEKDTKKYKKDTASLKEIIKEIDVLEYDDYEEKEEVENNDNEEINDIAE